MNGRKLTVLTAITAILALGKFASAFGIALGEDGPDDPGWPFAAAFGVFFLIAAWLLRSGQRPGHRGCRFVGILCLFELSSTPAGPSTAPWTGRPTPPSPWCHLPG